MQTIVETDTGISKYLFEDGHELTMSAANIICPNFIIGDMNTTNAELITGVTPPEDWAGCKYLYVNSNWELNLNWSEPSIGEEELA